MNSLIAMFWINLTCTYTSVMEHTVFVKPYVKGILHQKNVLSLKSHSLNSNGVWYGSFSEGPNNHLNLNTMVSKFVSCGFEARQTWAQQEGHSRRGLEGQQDRKTPLRGVDS